MKSKSEIEGTLISGATLMLLTRLIVKGIGIVSSLILARLLIPEDFGLVAIAMAFYAFIDLFSQFGFGTVLIQKQSASKDDYDTAWSFRIVFGVIVAIIMAISAPYLAAFYADDRLISIMYALAAVSILGGAQNIGVVDFQKHFQFKKELWFQIIPKFLNFGVTISMAVYLKNYWALIIGMVFNQLLSAVLSYLMHPYSPRFTLVSFKKLFSFSKWLMLNNVLFFLNTRLTELLIGKYVSTSATGIFSLGNEIASLPMTEIAAPINKASFPIYANCSKEIEKLQEAYISTLNLSSLLTIPASVGIFLIAEIFVNVVLGDNWLEVAPLMQWVAMSSMLFSLTTNNNYIYMATGRPHITFYLGLFRIVIFVPLFIYMLTANGLVGAGQALFITSVIMLLVTQTAIIRFLKISISPLLLTVFRPAIAAILMWLVLTQGLHVDELTATIWNLLLAVTLGAVTYCCSVLILWLINGKPEGLEKKIMLKIYSTLNKLGATGML